MPLLAPDCAEQRGASAGWQAAAGVTLSLLGALQFPHNSYTTNAWPFAVPRAALASVPDLGRKVIECLLCLARAMAPLHLAHGYTAEIEFRYDHRHESAP